MIREVQDSFDCNNIFPSLFNIFRYNRRDEATEGKENQSGRKKAKMVEAVFRHC